jgi:hypothetical protein
MYWEYRVRMLDNVEYRGSSEYTGVVEAEDKWQAFLKICEKESPYKLYNDSGNWIGCDAKSEEETKKELEEGTMQLHTGYDWDLDFEIEQVDKNGAFETVETFEFKRHISRFDVKLPIAKEDPDVDVRCILEMNVVDGDDMLEINALVDFEKEKLLYYYSDRIGDPIDMNREYDNIDEVFEIVKEFLASL